MKVSEMVEKTREVIALFHEVETRIWGIETMAVELASEVGTLADSIMIVEGYRSIRDGDKLDLEDDIADIIFILIRIADYYDIDLEQSYERMVGETLESLKKRIRAREK